MVKKNRRQQSLRQTIEALTASLIGNESTAEALAALGRRLPPAIRLPLVIVPLLPSALVLAALLQYSPLWLATSIAMPTTLAWLSRLHYLVHIAIQKYTPSGKRSLASDATDALRCRVRLSLITSLASAAFVIVYIVWTTLLSGVADAPRVPEGTVTMAVAETNGIGSCVLINFTSERFPKGGQLMALTILEDGSLAILGEILATDARTRRMGTACPKEIRSSDCSYRFAIVFVEPGHDAVELAAADVTGLKVADGCLLEPENTRISNVRAFWADPHTRRRRDQAFETWMERSRDRSSENLEGGPHNAFVS